MTTPMPISAADLQPLLPELTLIAGAFALLMLDLFLDNARRFITHALALVVMVAVVWMLATGVGGQGSVFSGMFVRDTLADVSKVVIVAVSALSLVYGWPYLRERNLYPGEAPVLAISGETIPAAVITATVAEPIITRSTAVATQANTSGGMCQLALSAAMRAPTPLSTSTCLNTPPAVMISRITAIPAMAALSQRVCASRPTPRR